MFICIRFFCLFSSVHRLYFKSDDILHEQVYKLEKTSKNMAFLSILKEVQAIFRSVSLQSCLQIFDIFFWTCFEYFPVYRSLQKHVLLDSGSDWPLQLCTLSKYDFVILSIKNGGKELRFRVSLILVTSLWKLVHLLFIL